MRTVGCSMMFHLVEVMVSLYLVIRTRIGTEPHLTSPGHEVALKVGGIEGILIVVCAAGAG
jgi:hypothetical protein